ncbi:erythrocyte membrane protein 1, PfEMP1, putative [Plasmodium gaboni]|uniref:Erythrocyte membrane protein 1, PfEMP1, putative n=1 Tax=Plasmodium gaboni TaxID=647221 RepID=A0ABY1UJW8_9APIC|nr:erythrocyte membrane protein 1, PfEMP1, putative [Plasmodium gaboni]
MGSRGSKFRDETLKTYEQIIGKEATSWGYGDYIHFLTEEINNKNWDNGLYDKFLTEKGWNPRSISNTVNRICAWEKVQQDIFQAVMDNYSTIAFTWEEKAEKLIENARNDHFNKQTCDKFNHQLIEEIDIVPDVKEDKCKLNTVDDLCIPLRRSKFHFDTISDNIKQIKSGDGGSETTRAISAVTSAIASLAKQITEDIVKLKNEYKDNKDLCTFLKRTYADYKDIIENKDIVNNKTSKGLQCLLNETKKDLKEPNKALSLLKEIFKTPIENILPQYSVDSGDKQKSPCNLDDSYYIQTPQCLRFLEEWFEDYSKEKELFETNIKDICLEGKTKEVTLYYGSKQKYRIPCAQYCYEYERLLSKRKACYNDYLTKCKENLKNHDNYKDTSVYKTEVERIQRKTKEKYDCSDADCGNDGNVKLEAFFNPKKLSTNKIYCCGCINNPKDIKEIFGTKDNKSSYIDAILNKLKICATTDNDLNGATDGQIMSKIGKKTDICMINYSDSNLSGTGTCSGPPCKDYYNKEKEWICDSTKQTSGEQLKTGWNDGNQSACLPPRTQRLCLGRIYSNKCTTQSIENIDTNEKLLNELIIAAKYEGIQLYSKYRGKASEIPVDKISDLCNAAKYSFSDLGDIVKGTSIWESNDMRAMENQLRTIFGKIYTKIPHWNQDKYKDSAKPAKYLKLREVWWNTNRQHIWKALVCSINRVSVNNPITCISQDHPPNIDYMPQFLRWMIEWNEEFCENRKRKLEEVKTSCLTCNKGKDCVPVSVECKVCDKKCKDYQKFITDAKNQYTKQKNKYEKQINDITNKYKAMRTNFYDDNIQKNTEEEFYNFLYNTNRYSGYFLNNYMKNKNLCNDSKVRDSSKNIDFTNVNQTFNDTPDGYENECSCSNSTSQSKKKPASSSDKSQNINIKAYLHKDACLINENDDGVYNDSNNFPCNSKKSVTQKDWKCNFNQSNGFSLKQSWSTNGKGACLPPRTQEICLGNLDKNDLKKKINENSNDGNVKNRKLLEELVLAAKYDGEKLWERNQNKNDNRSVCLQLRNSYADYGDLVKGTSIWENASVKTAEKNIGEILKDIFKHKLATEYDNDPIKLRKAWWEENKKDIWDAITCRIPHNEIFVIRKRPSDGRGIEYSVTGKCGYSQKLPDDDDIPQFLRWFKEWSNDFCEKYTEEKTNLEIKCQGCDGTNGNNCQNNKNAGGSTCSQCKKLCGNYKSWITNQKEAYTEQKQKYIEKISEAQNNSQSNSSGNTDNTYYKKLIDKKINSAIQYLESSNYETHCGKYNDINFINENSTFNNTPLICKSCEEKKKENPGVDGRTISTKEELEKGQTRRIYTGGITNDCMGVEELAKIQPATSSNTVSSSTSTLEPNNQNNQNISYNIRVCNRADPSLYGAQKNNYNSEWTVTLKQKSNNKDVEIVKNSSDITYKDSVFTTTNGRCSEPPCRNSNIGRKWIWEKSINNSRIAGLKKVKNYVNKIGIPPRTQVLCFGNIHGEFCVDAFSKVTTKEQLLMEWVIAAKHEGENLKNNYRNNIDNSKLCRAVKYSFADIGDLIKGTSIWENKWTSFLENNLKQIFENVFKDQYKKDNNKDSSGSFRYQSLGELREIWWNTNKKFIWHSLYKGAGLNSTNECSGIDEKFTPTIDHIPQFLRFMQEWIEHLCEERKKKIDRAIKSCKDCKEEQEKHNEEEGKECWKDNGKEGKNSTECKNCMDACEEYKKFISGKDDNDNIPWRERWKNIYEKYMQLINESLNSENDGTMPCGVDDKGIYINCPKADISSFFKNLYDQGYTTPSSYLSLVIKNNICGDDKPYFSRVMDNNENKHKTNELTAPYGSVFGDKPSGYKYACDCRIPSREEICDDKGLYSNDWKCGNGTTAGTSTGVVDPTKYPAPISSSTNNNYEICTTKNMITTSSTNTRTSVVANHTLDAEDHNFFNWFDIWYHDIQTQIDKYANRIEKTCSDEQIKNNNFPGNNHNHQQIQTTIDKDKCKECKGNCECYNLWTEKIDKQWQKQKTNYNIFNNKQKHQHGEHNSVRTVSLGNYLFFSCWEKYIKQHLKGDWEQIKSLDTETLDLLEKRCGKSINDGDEIFNERIKNVKKKGTECNKRYTKCTYDDKKFECEKYDDVGACLDKYYDGSMEGKKKQTPKNWECKNQNTSTDTKDVCVPPRTQTLFVEKIKDSDINNLQQNLKNAMKTETERLYDYYKSGTPIITTKDDTDKNGLPKNFCHAAKRTYNDFKNLVTGEFLWKAGSFGAIDKKINEIITKQTSGKTRQEWWNEHEYELWDAVRCGIKDKEKTSGEKFSGNECGYHPPNDTDDPFVWWFKEWGQQFCIERKKHMKEINEKCSSSAGKRCNGSVTEKTLKDGDCKKTCDAYQKFIKDKKSEWDKQKKKYERDNPGMKSQELLGLSYPECVGTNFELIFEEKEPENSKPSTGQLKYPYGDSGDICSCDEQKYDCKVNVSTCKEKTGDVTSWRTGLLKKGTSGKQLQGVYAPPRRQKLCLANLHPINFGNGADITSKKNDILNRLKIVAEREAYYLWKQHTKDKINDRDAHHRACCAIRASFFDIGDIVKGTDLWDDGSKKYIDQTIYGIFEKELEEKKKKKTIYGDPVKQARKKWWEENRDKVWKAMQCGVTNVLKELNGQKKKYDEIDCMKDKIDGKPNLNFFATPQFVRWLEEWTQQFCEKYTTHMSELEQKCGNGGNNDDCNSAGKNGCKEACTKYNDWITSKKKEWDDMSKYYEDVKGMDQYSSPDGVDYHAVNLRTAIKYLNQICNNDLDGTDKCCHCEKVGKESTASQKSNDPLEHMDKVVNRNDDKYKKYLRRCNNCYIQHINDQINEIKKKLDKRREKEDEEAKTKYSFDCENSGSQGNGGDKLCSKLTDGGKDEEPQKIKVPIDPDNTNKAKNKENDGMNCGGIPSNESEYIWKHKDGKEYHWVTRLNENMQIPPRRQKLCYNGLDGSKTQHELKYNLFRGAANDAYNLGIKYPEYNNHYGVKPCKALQYSFRDYYNIIMGTDNLEDQGEGTDKSIKESLQNLKISKGNSNDDKENRKQFWEQNKECLWRIMKCGYEKGRNEANQKKSNGNVPELTTEEGGATNKECNMPTDTNTDQFLSWFREWYEDYCNIRKKLKSDVETSCRNNAQNFDCEKCPTSCDKYEKYMKKKKEEWDKQNQYYSTKRTNGATGVNNNGYTESSAQYYLKKKFPNSCGDQPNSGTNDVEANITALTTQPNYDVDSQCGCTKYIEDNEYGELVGKPNCKGLKSAANETQPGKGIKWRNTDDVDYRYLKEKDIYKNEPISANIYIPPRKQNLCFRGLDGKYDNVPNSVKDEKTLRKQLMKVAATEGYNLGEYYKEKAKNKRGSDPDKYNYDVLPCNAMKYSFYDLRDIILGYDMLEPEGTDTEIKIKEIIGKEVSGKQGNGDPGSDKRKSWWNDHEKCIWNAMKCGYKKSRDDGNSGNKPSDTELTNCKDPPKDSDYPIGKNREEGTEYQFLRWFAEWGEDFCKYQEKEYAKLEGKCKFSTCNDANDNEKRQCRQACWNYQTFLNKWKKEYRNQNIEFEGLTYTKNLNPQKEAPEYLREKCKGTCSCIKDRHYTHNKSFEYPPDNFKDKCVCQLSDPPKRTEEPKKKTTPKEKDDPYKGLENCPFENGDNDGTTVENNEKCKILNENIVCMKNKYENDLDQWTILDVNQNRTKNKGVIVPPRRRNICFSHVKNYYRKTTGKDKLRSDILKTAFTHGKLLGQVYSANQNLGMKNMKYSYADIADIVKGTDMLENHASRKIKDLFFKFNGNPTHEQWWKDNKKKVWHAMLCGYKKGNPTAVIKSEECTLPNTDKDDQFLRWLEEWAQLFCKEKVDEAKNLVKECLQQLQKESPKTIDEIKYNKCKHLLNKYRNWYIDRKSQWEGLNEAYRSRHANGAIQASGSSKEPKEQDAEKYVKSKCSECDCKYKDLEDINKVIKESEEKLLSELIFKAKIDSIVPKETTFYKIFTLGELGPDILKDVKEFIPNIIYGGILGTLNTYNIGKVVGDTIINKIKDLFNKEKNNATKPTPQENDASSSSSSSSSSNSSSSNTQDPNGGQYNQISNTPLTPSVEPTTPSISQHIIPTTVISILGTTILGLILYKKKPKTPLDIFRVIDIPQNDYGIPDETSTNRYVPYSRYKGKTYIYMEGNEPDDYLRDISSSDVTSSESEYEEVDINDIYPHKSPKYKTLIEVVLKPSTNNNVQDTYTDDVKNNSDIPINKLTDEEWNQLKQDFISQYLQNIPKDLSNENKSGNTFMDSQPNIIHNNMEEKPFITSIQDRFLDNHEKINYDIDWNVPENITTNNVDIPKYVTSNDKYSGIDLINDSLNSDQHIDIYDELLKRKENELFGTKHLKNTTTNSVVKDTYSDPILNHLDLFDKWLDRHRNMCNKWNNKEEMLNQLNEEWKNENKEHVLDIPLNDNAIHKINDETYNMINENTNELNDITSLEDFGSTNIPYRALITQSNDSQRQNLRTNISMDIHFDENNNNVTNEDDQLENSYNF